MTAACRPYFCPTSGETECCPAHSGWDTCCSRPELHAPLPAGDDHQRMTTNGEFTADQSTWPAHLRDDAPRQQCSSCRRFTVATSEFGRTCNMPQPGGNRCTGTFGAPA